MKRALVAMVLIFLFLSSTTVLYAQMTETDDVVLDSISQFYLVDQKLQNNRNATLVPIGAIRSVNDVYYITYEYEIIVKDGLNLQVEIDDLLFSNSDVSDDELYQTFQFDVSKTVTEQVEYNEHLLGNHIQANRVIVEISISMAEPPSYELMQLLAGGSLTFEVYFFAA